MTIKSRVPSDLSDERAMRAFHDRLDRNHIKVGEMADLATSPTTDEIAVAINAILAIFRSK